MADWHGDHRGRACSGHLGGPVAGVRGWSEAIGVEGVTISASGIGVAGSNQSSGTSGHLGGPTAGVYGNGSVGGRFESSTGFALSASGPAGSVSYIAGATFGVRGYSPQGLGVYGTSDSSVGVSGDSSSGNGVEGFTVSGGRSGVYGENTASNGYGVYGANTSSSSFGYLGGPDAGVFADAGSAQYGILAETGFGASINGVSTEYSGTAIFGVAHSGPAAYAIWGQSSSGFAGFFDGDVAVVGNLSKSGGSFKIDHPLDPEGMYLSHSFVESPDMMNVYNGNVVTDEEGYAVVELPEYFEALNRDYRYQLTVIGRFAQAIVAEEVQDGRFVIRTNLGMVKVSWQVTGIRHDPWAEENRIPVEETKPPEEQGSYLNPEVYGQPASLRLRAIVKKGVIPELR